MTDTPVLTIDGAADLLHETGTDRHILRMHAEQVSSQHAAYATAEAAAALRQLFGGAAHRAVFKRTNAGVDAGVDAELLVLFDRDDKVIWYNIESALVGTPLVAARDDSDEPMPHIERDTLHYIESLVEWAEESLHDGFLPSAELISDPDWPAWRQAYADDFLIELIVDDSIAAGRRTIGEPARDGTIRPQRCSLSPNARNVAVLALQRLLDMSGRMFRVPLTADEKTLLGEVITALDPH